MSNLNWFKHYNTASESGSIECLLANGDHEAVACYWILLEIISRFEDQDNRGKIDIPVKVLAKRWFMSCPKVERILARLMLNMRSTLDCTLSESWPKVASITVRNWLELQQTKGTYDRHKKTITTGEVRSKKLDIRIKNKNTKKAPLPAVADFDILYQKYPRKEGKTKGKAVFEKQIKTQQDWEDIQKAVDNYADSVADREKQYIKQFSTFMNCWRDYLTPVEKSNGKLVVTREDLLNDPDLAYMLGIDPNASGPSK